MTNPNEVSQEAFAEQAFDAMQKDPRTAAFTAFNWFVAGMTCQEQFAQSRTSATSDAARWQPIADGLPEPHVPVLCFMRRIHTGEFIVGQSCVNSAGTGFYVEYDDSDSPLEEVTHWQNLPPPPVSAGGGQI